MPQTAKELAVSSTIQVWALAIVFITSLFSNSRLLSLSLSVSVSLSVSLSLCLSLSLSFSPATVVDESKTKVSMLIMLQLDALHAPLNQSTRAIVHGSPTVFTLVCD